MSSLLSIPGPVLSLSFMTIPLLVSQYAQFQETTDYAANIVDITLPDNSVYDFIVVGGGSAGATLANRLSAPPKNYKVLLLEAGGDPSWVTYIPVTDIFTADNPGTSWQYESIPARNCCLSMRNRVTKTHRGKSLGGTSQINFMIYLRGNQAGFDEWGNITGDPSWNANGVLPYFMKSEDYHGNYPNPAVHGTGGPLYIDKFEYQPSIEAFSETLRQYGIEERDVNDNQTESWMRLDTNTNNGVRWSTYSAFIRPILRRKNFVICRYCHVNKLLFDPSDSRSVIGVEYVRHNNTVPKYAYANKEVILSAGAFNSPKILMLSGIGPADHLSELGIPVRLNNPNIGANLQDHCSTSIPFIFNETDTSFLPERDLIPETLHAYNDFKTGPLAANNVHSTGYTSSPVNGDPNFPDLQFFIVPLGASLGVTESYYQLFNFRKRTFDKYMRPYIGSDGHYIIVSQVKPKSLGSVRLRSRRASDNPVIDMGYLTDPAGSDVQSLIWGVKYAVAFIENSIAYRRLGAHFPRNKYPGCEKYDYKSDNYYECYIRHFTATLWHFSSTCRMGHRDDPAAVVDTKLRVLGINRLRVVDASVMPIVTNGNTNAPTIMIAEKGADMILQYWNARHAVATSNEDTLISKIPRIKLPFDFQDVLGLGLGLGPGLGFGPQARILTPTTAKPPKTRDNSTSDEDEPGEDKSSEEEKKTKPFCIGKECKKLQDDYDDDEKSDKNDSDDEDLQFPEFPFPFPPYKFKIPQHETPSQHLSAPAPHDPSPFQNDFYYPFSARGKFTGYTERQFWPPSGRRFFKHYEHPNFFDPFENPYAHHPYHHAPKAKGPKCLGEDCFPKFYPVPHPVQLDDDDDNMCHRSIPFPPWEHFYHCSPPVYDY